MFLLVSVRHVGAHPDELQHGVSIQSSINLGKTFPQISRIRIIPSTQILARVFVYLPPFISQILDFTCRMFLIFILIYFEWRDWLKTSNTHTDLLFKKYVIIFLLHVLDKNENIINARYWILSENRKNYFPARKTNVYWPGMAKISSRKNTKNR